MKYLKLGSTDLTVSEVGFGGIPIIRLDTDEAISVIMRAYEQGITFFDTASVYRDSEDKMGRAFQGIRNNIVIATKTLFRDAYGALLQLDNSLRKLRTDYIDLYQFHQIAQEKDYQAVTAPDGALNAILKAKEAGKVRYIGVTSHNLQMAIKLVRTGLFSTIQFPFNFIETEPINELYPAAREHGLGMIIMKPFAGGVIDNAHIAFKFLRQFPDTIPIPGFDSLDSVDEVVSIYNHTNQVTEMDKMLMDEYRKKFGKTFCRRCEYCEPCPNKVKITGAMVYTIIASRMAPKAAVEFARDAMETVPRCAECGICKDRCPYELDIPSMIKCNYMQYTMHLKEIR